MLTASGVCLQNGKTLGRQPEHLSRDTSAKADPNVVSPRTKDLLHKSPPVTVAPDANNSLRSKTGTIVVRGFSTDCRISSMRPHTKLTTNIATAILDQSQGRDRDRGGTSFNGELATRVYHVESEKVFEDTDAEEDWEEDYEPSGPSSFDGEEVFQRVDSKPNLQSSLLTSMICEDGAAAVQNAASHSSRTVHRSRSTPSPRRVSQSSNSLSLALSLRTTRRLMLSDEMSQSLGKQVYWERQDKKSTINAALKRGNTAQNENQSTLSLTQDPLHRVASCNGFLVSDHLEYHQKGW